jgi:acyl-CoA thioesterase
MPVEPGAVDTVTFADQLALEPDGSVPGRYRVDVSPAWNCPIVPQGGVMVALAARAMGLELERSGTNGQPPTLRSLTTVFAAQVAAGPVIFDVSVLRQGRSMAQARAEVRSPGADAGHSTLAVFGQARPGFEFTDVAMPDVPPPEDCPSFRDPWPDDVEAPPGRRMEMAFWDKVEGRAALSHAPWDDWVPTSSDTASWYRFDDPPRHSDGSLDRLALIPFCDVNPGALRERMGPRTPQWLPPSVDLTVHLFAEPKSEWLLGHHRARWAGDGYVSVSVNLWDPAVGLVAYATQVMFLVFPEGPPVGDERFPADQRRGDA